ncbi:hypothetical protein D6D19_02698 [Aureobasidium pullulans]|uniref:Uncharacterized protein n=1 Tax=Aureobasidium pullulans TaxID=5580 RepID=A0A4S9ACI4_AURPU|nr:hypothetical protein D6D19_02698 [Aureobasidium pullulans]THY98687.1 hypothetical protein D6C92_02738 [Aureobasidium pullulans]TIA21101.1 hypothetical protein D6C81_03956 [Aureobasidium pullulans]
MATRSANTTEVRLIINGNTVLTSCVQENTGSLSITVAHGCVNISTPTSQTSIFTQPKTILISTCSNLATVPLSAPSLQIEGTQQSIPFNSAPLALDTLAGHQAGYHLESRRYPSISAQYSLPEYMIGLPTHLPGEDIWAVNDSSPTGREIKCELQSDTTPPDASVDTSLSDVHGKQLNSSSSGHIIPGFSLFTSSGEWDPPQIKIERMEDIFHR